MIRLYANVSLAVACAVAYTLTALPAGAGETVDIGGLKVPADCPLVTGEHPRILFAKRDLPAIKKRIAGAYAADFKKLKEQVDASVARKIKVRVVAQGVPLGFLYQMTGDEKYAEAARTVRGWSTNPILIDLLHEKDKLTSII